MKLLKHFLFVAVAVVFCSCSVNTTKSDADVIPVILDTDVGNDIDDVIALQMLLNYHKEGKIDLLGIGVGKNYSRVIEYIDAFCRFNGMDNVPLGYAYEGPNPDAGLFVSQTLDTLIDGAPVFAAARKLDESIPEGYKLYRKLLASQPDSSVVFLAIGPVTNLGNLLSSPADEYSDLTGKELVSKKVRLLSIMSGTYNDDTFNNPEWNVLQDLEASKKVYAEWPTELIASGSEVGVRILYPHQSILNDFPGGEANPLCISYKLYDKMPYDRPTWDLTSVIYAIEPEASCLDISPAGDIVIAEDGKAVFVPNPDGKHRFLKIAPENVKGAVDALVQAAKVEE